MTRTAPRLEDLTWPEVAELASTDAVVVVPVGTVEQHGPHLPIDTDNRMAITGAIRKVFVEQPGKFDPRDYLVPARAAMQKLCEERYQQFQCDGQASKIKVLPLTDMAARYADGSLDPQVR